MIFIESTRIQENKLKLTKKTILSQILSTKSYRRRKKKARKKKGKKENWK